MPRILLIEDDAPLRRTIARVLASAGHEVLDAADGKAAIRQLEGDTVDLVITDINMPEMDGIEVIRRLHETTPELPVVAVSGGGLIPKEVLLGNAGHLGAVEVISKPFEIEDLLRAVTRALGAPDDQPRS